MWDAYGTRRGGVSIMHREPSIGGDGHLKPSSPHTPPRGLLCFFIGNPIGHFILGVAGVTLDPNPFNSIQSG